MPLTTATAAGLIAGGAPIATEDARMRIRAIRDCFHGGNLLAAGQPYEIPEAAALNLIMLRRAERLSEDAPVGAEAPEAVAVAADEPAAAPARERRSQKEA